MIDNKLKIGNNKKKNKEEIRIKTQIIIRMMMNQNDDDVF